jgi:toxin YoeB
MRKLKWSSVALADLEYWKKTDSDKYKKIWFLCESICKNPQTGLGKPEPLKHQFTGYWSRRIDKKHRLVYKFNDEEVYVIQARGHYSTS